MLVAMNAIAQASAGPASGPQLDNRRVVAGLIDLMVVLAGALVIGFAAGVSGAEYQKLGLAMSGVISAWALYYYFACESGGGQTLGKKLMRIRVVRLDGSPAGMGDVGVRTILRVIDGLFLYLVGLVVMLVTGERRGRLGDLAAGTMIVSADADADADAGAATAPAIAAVASATITLPTPAPETPTPSPELKELARDGAGEPDSTAEPEAELEVKPFEAPAFEIESRAAPEPVLEVQPFEAPPHPAVPIAAPLEGPDDDEEPVVVNSLDTVSAIDLVMEEEPQEPA
jgi:uncharacterized RDD family membrane protein YckC